LFPLSTVLFPGCNLDLQIFEARYLDMIGRCMKQGGGFGVVCILEGSEVGDIAPDIAGIGCEARITDFQKQDNGLLGIRVEGGRRFEVLNTELQRDLLVADVHWLDESRSSRCRTKTPIWWRLKALAEHPMVEALNMNTEALGSSHWPISWPTCCPSPKKTRSICCNWTTRSSASTGSRPCSKRCRASCLIAGVLSGSKDREASSLLQAPLIGVAQQFLGQMAEHEKAIQRCA
jgi:hypothetical protein